TTVTVCRQRIGTLGRPSARSTSRTQAELGCCGNTCRWQLEISISQSATPFVSRAGCPNCDFRNDPATCLTLTTQYQQQQGEIDIKASELMAIWKEFGFKKE